MKHRAVIFDCDGTLVDSERIGVEVLLEVAKEHGASFERPNESGRIASWTFSSEDFVDQVVVTLRGLSMAQCLETLERQGHFRFPADIEATVRERTARHFRERLQMMPGAGDFVRELKIPHCVASSGPRSKIELSLGLTGLLQYFEGRIFSSYEIGSWKPEPDLFLHAAKALGVEPADCAVIEDSQPGVDAGVNAGMFVYGFGPVELVLPRERAVRAKTYAELRPHFVRR